jgi:hypothetical protein
MSPRRSTHAELVKQIMDYYESLSVSTGDTALLQVNQDAV